MRPVRLARAGVLVVACALGISWALPAGATPPAAPDSTLTSTATPSSAALVWKACGSGFQCSTLTVPVDASAPTTTTTSPTVDLAVIRDRARDTEHRIGTLVVNPGGPGVPAVEFLRGAASSLPSELRDRFDLVAFDPRGVGESDPIECQSSLDPVFDQSFGPTTAASRAALVDSVTALAQQ